MIEEPRAVPEQVLADLIDLGRSDTPAVPESLADSKVAWRALMCGFEPWDLVIKKFEPAQLVLLIRGLVLYSEASGWTGGSVSPISHLYRECTGRDPDADAKLSEWIHEHGLRDFEPFGRTVTRDSRPINDYHGDEAGSC